MLPRLSIEKQQTATSDTVVLNISWGTLVLGFTITKRPLVVDFEDELYPHQKSRSVVAISILLIVHAFIAYLLLAKRIEHKIKLPEEGQLVFFDLKTKVQADKPRPPRTQPQKRPQPVHTVTLPPVVESIKSISPVAAAPVEDTTARIARAREQRRLLEQQAVEENSAAQEASQGPSDNDAAMARIKANIQSANYNKKGTGGVFQITHKGAQTGTFTFRGWTNAPDERTRQTYEVDAGIGGDVKLAIIRRMIQLIRDRFKGDFTWESQRLGRDVTLSARPQDNAALEEFLMKEFPD